MEQPMDITEELGKLAAVRMDGAANELLLDAKVIAFREGNHTLATSTILMAALRRGTINPWLTRMMAEKYPGLTYERLQVGTDYSIGRFKTAPEKLQYESDSISKMIRVMNGYYDTIYSLNAQFGLHTDNHRLKLGDSHLLQAAFEAENMITKRLMDNIRYHQIAPIG